MSIDTKDATILRLRTRLTIVEPVYRAAIAVHRVGAKGSRGEFERVEDLERAVDRAIEIERLVAEGHVIRIDAELP